MGVDVSCIFKHNLSFGNTPKMAAEIAIIFDCKVEYGFLDKDYEFQKEGEIGNGKHWFLIKYFSENGENDRYDLTLHYAEDKLNDEINSSDFYICKHIVQNNIYPGRRWRNFTDCIISNEEGKYLSPYRNATKAEATLFGADEAFYFPDSSNKETLFIEEDKEWMTWDELKEKAHKLLKDNLYNISKKLQKGTWRDEDGGVELYFDDFSYILPIETKLESIPISSIENTIPKAKKTEDDYGFDWYEHLISQSKTDHIYDLIHGCIPYDWNLAYKRDYLIVEKSKLPQKLRFLEKNTSEQETKFDNPDFVILNNETLEDFLEAARYISVVSDKTSDEFLLLHFEMPQATSTIGKQNKRQNNQPFYENIDTVKLEDLEHSSDSLWLAYQFLYLKKSKAQALFWAKIGFEFLNNQVIGLDNAGNTDEIFRKCMGYNIVSMVFAWNGKMKKAWLADQEYIFFPFLWPLLKNQIESYLEMLMAKKKYKYLARLFEDADFKAYFKNHFEVYYSLAIDETFQFSDAASFVAILGRINNSYNEFR